MVEGHSVHRVAHAHRQKLVSKKFCATSPNGRFTEGAACIDGKKLCKIEVIGKNLFYFFSTCEGTGPNEFVVMHVHFGMAGAFAVGNLEMATKSTTRLRLTHAESGLSAHLSAMTVRHGTVEQMYDATRAKLGHDPLRQDSNGLQLWDKVKKSKKSIGRLLMDQGFFAGVGNIYRCEILFVAGLHPDVLGCELTIDQFIRVWDTTVKLMQRGFQTGSILTVDSEEGLALGRPKLRRWIYNQARCARCGTSIVKWEIVKRTCYACPTCQPPPESSSVPSLQSSSSSSSSSKPTPVVPFVSHCVRDSLEERLRTPSKLRVAELKLELAKRSLDTKGKKAMLVARLQDAMGVGVEGVDTQEDKNVPASLATQQDAMAVGAEEERLTRALSTPGLGLTSGVQVATYHEAANEKKRANEKRNVEHVADVEEIIAREEDGAGIGELEAREGDGEEPAPQREHDGVYGLERTLAGHTVDWGDLNGSAGARVYQTNNNVIHEADTADTIQRQRIPKTRLASLHHPTRQWSVQTALHLPTWSAQTASRASIPPDSGVAHENFPEISMSSSAFLQRKRKTPQAELDTPNTKSSCKTFVRQEVACRKRARNLILDSNSV